MPSTPPEAQPAEEGATPPLRRRPRRRLRLMLWALLALTVLGIIATAGGAYLFARHLRSLEPTTPGIDALRQVEAARPSMMVAADGQVLAVFARTLQERVALDRISEHVTRALIATEDHRFYEHRGIDVLRTAGAAWNTLNGRTQGGSTITQQLARNLFPEAIGRERTINRKLKELVTAMRIERTYTKHEILEHYLNTAPFLYNVVGIEMAARTYFSRSAADLDVLQSATLVGMLKGAHYFNPVTFPERARERRNVVLAQMVRHGDLGAEAFERLRDEPLGVRFNRPAEPPGIAPHFTAHARRWALEWAQGRGVDLHSAGLVIETSLDPVLQGVALQAVQRQADALQTVADVEWATARMPVPQSGADAYAKLRDGVEPFAHLWRQRAFVEQLVRTTPDFRKALEGASSEEAALHKLMSDGAWMSRFKADKSRLEAGFIAIDPQTAEVKAWVGSRSFEVDQFDHVAQAARQPGSTFKPFVYAAALERGIVPEQTYFDTPLEIALHDGSVWKPTDMSGASLLAVSMRDGLVYSKNSITVQVLQDAGVSSVVELARAMGVNRSALDAVPSLALGTSPVTLLEMTSAYATLARQGEYREPVVVRRIVDRTGRVVAQFGDTAGKRVMSEDTAVELVDMMRGVITQGTGAQIRTRFGVKADVAGKTGTTQDNTDGWFVLMHPQIVAGAWVGFNDARITMRSDHWGQGGHNAILLVGDFLRSALDQRAIDAGVTFPESRRPPVPLTAPWPDDLWAHAPNGWVRTEPPGSRSGLAARVESPADEVESAGAAAGNGSPPPHAPAAHAAQPGAVASTLAAFSTPSPTTTTASQPAAEDVERVLRSLGIDPLTGAPLAAASQAVAFGARQPAGSNAVRRASAGGSLRAVAGRPAGAMGASGTGAP